MAAFLFVCFIKMVKVNGLSHVTGGYMNHGCLGEKLTKKSPESGFKPYKKIQCYL